MRDGGFARRTWQARAWYAAALVVSCSPCLGQSIERDRSGGAVRDRAVIVRADQFGPAVIEKLSRRFLTEARGTALARLTMATNSDALSRALVHTGMNPTYASTVEDIRTYKLPQTPVARLLVFGGTALLSYRDEKGYSERVIAGSSVSGIRLSEQGTEFQILHFFLREPGPALSSDSYSITIYLRSSPAVSIAAVVAATKHLVDLTKLPQVDVEVRQDAWFMESFEFPSLLPFQEKLELPSNLQFTTAPYVSCGFTTKYGLQCSGHSFRP